jgi:ADP-heptose:LPS heptosyltransferase
VLLAETSDAGFGETICGRASGCHNLVGQLSLAEAIDLLSVADLVIGDQSEFMYLALALGRQVLMLASPDHLDGVCDLFPEGRFLPLETDPADIVSVLEDS